MNVSGAHRETIRPIGGESNGFPATAFLSAPVKDPRAIQDGLSRLLGRPLHEVASKKTEIERTIPVSIPGGTANLKVNYRPEYNDVLINVSEDPEKSFRVSLDDKGNPETFYLARDRGGILPRLASLAGLNISKELLPDGKSELPEWSRTAIEFASVRQAVRELTSKGRSRPAGDYYGKTGVSVAQGQFQVASLDRPLTTGGLDTCSALVVIDRKSGRHYLAHVDAATNPEGLVRSLAGLNLKSAEIALVPGSGWNELSMIQAFKALKSLGVSDRVKIIDGSSGMFAGITLQGGSFFRGLPPGTNWPEKGERI